jgi:hypothetical protein
MAPSMSFSPTREQQQLIAVQRGVGLIASA